jgi:hypothetical protein
MLSTFSLILSSRTHTRLCSPYHATQLSRTLRPFLSALPVGVRLVFIPVISQCHSCSYDGRRAFSTSPMHQMRDLSPINYNGQRVVPISFMHRMRDFFPARNNDRRVFSTSPMHQMRDFFPAKETEQIRETLPAWPHHGYTEEEMLAVVPAHRKPVTWGDYFAC